MRYSRAQYENSKTSQQKGSRSFLFFAILAAVIVGVYLIGVAKVGDFLSQKIVTPVVSWLTGEDVKAPSESKNAGAAPVISPAASNAEKEMKLPGGTIFALQVGLYAEENNAKDASAQLVSKGGAGYILQTAEGKRVLIAGYATREDAENVQQRLLKEQQMQTSVFEMSTQEMTVTVSSDADSLAKIETALSSANKYYDDLMGYAISFDKQELDKAALQQNIAGMKSDAAGIKANLQKLEAGDNKVIGALIAYYEKVETALAKAEADLSDAALSSQVKEVYLEIGAAKMELVGNLQN
jgi:hypothetical protein